MYLKQFAAAAVMALLLSCGNNNPEDNKLTTPENNTNPAPPAIGYTIIKTYPHDTSSYTEGLFWLNNALWESTGNYGSSELRKNNLATGKPERMVKLDKQYFGEGISVINNKLYQLTYKEKTVFVYDTATFKKVKEFEWVTGEGWGMTHNDSELIISNGSSNLYFVDPETFKIKRITGVTDNYGPVTYLNELEYVDGSVYANIWQTNTIVKIDPVTGKVTGKMDMAGLLDKNGMPEPDEWYEEGNVLNGIAYDPAKKSFYVTGKDWPAVFEIKLN
ncbi:MAG TPA: glutaminyl-peptide cyclotransferase [Chitinophagaceae bacterium]|nr:glutaminyl-peptide cyclotransferase [Chitinophagaceae bacterium]